MTNSRIRSGRSSKRVMNRPEEPEEPRSDGLYAGRLSEDREAEIRTQYYVKGWTEVEGLITLGFISKCGEWFNCYCKRTGHFYSFGTTEALRIRLEDQRKKSTKVD